MTYTLLKTSNAPFIILPISYMKIIWVILNLQYNKFKEFKSIFWILKIIRLSFLRTQHYVLNSETLDWFSCAE